MDEALRDTIARKVWREFGEEAVNAWFAHDVGEIDDLEFLAAKKQFFERAGKALTAEEVAVGEQKEKEITRGRQST